MPTIATNDLHQWYKEHKLTIQALLERAGDCNSDSRWVLKIVRTVYANWAGQPASAPEEIAEMAQFLEDIYPITAEFVKKVAENAEFAHAKTANELRCLLAKTNLNPEFKVMCTRIAPMVQETGHRLAVIQQQRNRLNHSTRQKLLAEADVEWKEQERFLYSPKVKKLDLLARIVAIPCRIAVWLAIFLTKFLEALARIMFSLVFFHGFFQSFPN